MKTFSLATLAFWLLAVIVAHLAGSDPNHTDLDAVLQWPSQQHWLGTDDLGRDILARVIRGVEVSFMVTVIVTAVTMTIGISIGLFAGYKGGRVDDALMQLTSIFLAFPGILLAIAFAAVLGAGINNLILALCLTGWVTYDIP